MKSRREYPIDFDWSDIDDDEDYLDDIFRIRKINK
jgi:hypothetical protein